MHVDLEKGGPVFISKLVWSAEIHAEICTTIMVQFAFTFLQR